MRIVDRRWLRGGTAAASFVVLTQLSTRSELNYYHWLSVFLLSVSLAVTITVLFHSQIKRRLLSPGTGGVVDVAILMAFILGMAAFLRSFSETVLGVVAIAVALTIIVIELDTKRSSKKKRQNEHRES